MSGSQPPIPPPGIVGSDGKVREVIALVGFEGPGEPGNARLYPDIDFQRWMDFPEEDIVARAPLTNFNPGRQGRTVIWVTQESMAREVFRGDPLANAFAGSRMSTWNLLPGTRFVAAELLDLVPHLRYEKEN